MAMNSRWLRGSVFTLLAVASVSVAAQTGAAQKRNMWLVPEDEQVRSWNQFVKDVVALNEKRNAQREVVQEESTGGYELYPNFYREVLYRDKKTGHLLAEIQWERAQPDRVHSAEVYIRDEQGRLVRDYAVLFLPWGRNSPIQTLVSFYHYQPGLASFRKFDASGRTVYEDCRGKFQGKDVEIDLDEFDMAREADGVMKSAVYRQCFAALPAEAGKFLTPQ